MLFVMFFMGSSINTICVNIVNDLIINTSHNTHLNRSLPKILKLFSSSTSFTPSLIPGTSTVDAALLPNEWHSSGTLTNVILQCMAVANKLRIDLCFYKNTSGGNHHIGNKLMLICMWGKSSQMPSEFYLFIFFSVGGSSVVQSISVQSLLFSEVIKQRIDLLTGDSYLLPPPPVLCFAPLSSPQGGKVWAVWKLKPILGYSTMHTHTDIEI